jgi:putative esterase
VQAIAYFAARALEATSAETFGRRRNRVDQRFEEARRNAEAGERDRRAAGRGRRPAEADRVLQRRIPRRRALPGGGRGSTLTDAAWWRDRSQGGELRSGNLGAFHEEVDFGKLAAGASDDSDVPRTGPINRILASHFEPAQGVDLHRECGDAGECKGELLGRLQPYAIYVPAKPPPDGHGLTLLLHSLGANYNQFSASRNQSQLGERATGSFVITPAGRGPDGWYYDLAGADTFEVWADVAAHCRLDPDFTAISGYSMGGYGTYKLATQFPDLFARGQPVVGPPGLGIWLGVGEPRPGGAASNTVRQLASLRNVPFMMWVASSDELVPVSGTQAQARRFDELGYR